MHPDRPVVFAPLAEQFAEREVQLNGLGIDPNHIDKRIDRAIGLFTQKKIQPAEITCWQFALPAAEILMVGDSGNDTAAARAAGCPVFCVDYGYNEGVPLCAEECDALVGALPDILPLIECLPRLQRA